ncbi:hypothetical protein HPP92_028751 [Vanilla planifolia]|uniref:Uncharacterized protein n=1 Tax=Vanilla planifolia TaxID=51239 RepID=A0A835U378_VANPL|nr:hypothetical protein HPP92_028751 [Vanilla planifolia]KAG0446662.1 hypothetical protein HPP92_028740 [Vanilla planifolia]
MLFVHVSECPLGSHRQASSGVSACRQLDYMWSTLARTSTGAYTLTPLEVRAWLADSNGPLVACKWDPTAAVDGEPSVLTRLSVSRPSSRDPDKPPTPVFPPVALHYHDSCTMGNTSQIRQEGRIRNQ